MKKQNKQIGELLELKKFLVKPGKKVSLKDFDTGFKGEKKVAGRKMDKEFSHELLARGIERLAAMQDKLYAHNEYSVLIVLQAMDTAGKDGAIRHVCSGLNPQGVKVASFKAPNSQELDHDYFWRHYKELPERGQIGIFNRSHYENVIVTKVHPEFILNEGLPDVNSLKDINDKFWEKRYRQINNFERTLYENGTIILKFFLHLSKDEQKRRLISRIDDDKKNWKFSPADMKERGFWNDYQKAFEDMLSNTSTDYAPWHVLPADDKWYTRVAIAGAIYLEFERLNFQYPKVSEEQKKKLQELKKQLLGEK
ncbi:MAG: polyphosphate kinase 2 family protein [Bacteroidia bacterium]